MSSTFNSNFYVTSAAAIPLFYLAAFVQEGNVSGATGQIKNGIASTFGLAKIVWESMRKYLQGRGGPGIRGIGYRSGLIAAFLIPLILILSVLFVLAAVECLLLTAVFGGVLSEGISIWALFYQSDNLLFREIVLWAMLGLLAVMSVNPTVHVVKGLSLSSIFPRGPAPEAATDVVGGGSEDVSADRVQGHGGLVSGARDLPQAPRVDDRDAALAGADEAALTPVA